MNRRLLGSLGLLVIALALGGYGAGALARVSEMRREIQAQERELAALRERTEALARQVDRLRNDPAYIEQLAREDLGYVREGETVLKFPRQRPPQ